MQRRWEGERGANIDCMGQDQGKAAGAGSDCGKRFPEPLPAIKGAESVPGVLGGL